MGAVDGAPVLIPAYIGWSSREGSGIHDPILAAGASLSFYRIGRDLAIDLSDLALQLEKKRPRVVLFVHYFGFPDPRLAEAVALCCSHGALVLEDEAHALFSDLIGGVCGRFGDAAVFSLHKMLPFPSGGAIRWQDENGARQSIDGKEAHGLYDYDLAAISGRRISNARATLEALELCEGFVTPLYKCIPAAVVPQTLPILLNSDDRAVRDTVYEQMNARGYGVVSLYHTMIEPISQDEFPDSHWLSRRILNLPCHQDMEPSQAAELVTTLKQVIED